MDDLRNLHNDHVFLRREALAHDYRDQDLEQAIRDGLLVRVRHGAYTFRDVWEAANNVSRHSLRAHAVMRSHDAPIALSHTSAAVEHGLRLFRPDLSKVHVITRGKRLARTTGDVVYHRGKFDDDDFTVVKDQLVVDPVLAGLQAASLTTVAGGIVILDSVIDLDLGSREQIEARYLEIAGHPFSRPLQVTVRLVRKGAQSVGESLSRHMMWTEHLPAPELQFEVRDLDGRLIGTCDFAWPEYGVLGEFDGRLKYGRILTPGQDVGEVVFAEKQREDLLREITGCAMLRLTWGDYDRPRVVRERLLRLLRRAS